MWTPCDSPARSLVCRQLYYWIDHQATITRARVWGPGVIDFKVPNTYKAYVHNMSTQPNDQQTVYKRVQTNISTIKALKVLNLQLEHSNMFVSGTPLLH